MKMADSTTILVGLIGSGIRDSLSPALHERAGARCGYRYTYRLIDLQVLGHDVSALPSLLESAEREGFRGLNITHPCKQLVIPHLDELSESARIIGAVNTVVFRDGRRIGYNTDGSGFRAGIPRGRQRREARTHCAAWSRRCRRRGSARACSILARAA